jgi:hypothetical protein
VCSYLTVTTAVRIIERFLSAVKILTLMSCTPEHPSACLVRRGMPTIFLHLGKFRPALLGNFQPANVGKFQPAETGEYSTGTDSVLRAQRGGMVDLGRDHEARVTAVPSSRRATDFTGLAAGRRADSRISSPVAGGRVGASGVGSEGPRGSLPVFGVPAQRRRRFPGVAGARLVECQEAYPTPGRSFLTKSVSW